MLWGIQEGAAQSWCWLAKLMIVHLPTANRSVAQIVSVVFLPLMLGQVLLFFNPLLD